MSSATPSAFVRDVLDDDFESAVLRESLRRPVVVDFWAAWCAPCRQLGPLLERLAAEHAGAFLLAKVDVDAAPRTAGALQIRSIPTVLGFKDGRIVQEFVGAQPEAAVRRFLEALLPSEADRLAEEGAELAGRGHTNAAEERFRAALAQDARHARALVGLARALGERNDEAARSEALALLERVTGASELEAEAERLAAELRTRAAAAGAGADEAPLRARLAANPRDLAARIALGRALAARGAYEEALGEWLAAVRQDPKYEDEAARKAIVDVFALLGSDHPLTQRFRSELARALFR